METELKKLIHVSALFGLLLLLLTPNEALAKSIESRFYNAPSYEIKGKIIDAETGEGVPFCSVIIENTHSGTSSNEEGDFVISIETLPIKLIFSHLNYKKQSINITKNVELIVKLAPLAHSLDEVTLDVGDKNGYAIELAQKAFRQMSSLSSIEKYGKALYRQKAKNGDTYSEFSEIIYDIKYTTGGVQDWEIIEGRYALKENSVNNKNFTLLSRLLTAIQPNTNDLLFPLRESLENYYTAKIIDLLKTNEGNLIVVYLKPKPNVPKPAFEGEVYLNSRTYDVLKVIGSIAQDDVKLIKLTEKNTSKKNYNLSYEIAFKKDKELDLVLDYINVNQEFDYFKEETLKTHVSSESKLFFFEYYQPLRKPKLGRQFRRGKSDWENLNEIGYNQKFWQDNQIVKRTPVEQEVIDAFEKGNRFESMFLNSRQQIALMQSGIAGDPFIKWLGDSMDRFSQNNTVQKVYLHTNKEIFSSGDYLWYSAFGTIGPEYYQSLESQVLHVDLINADNKIVKSKYVELINGRGKGSIKIDADLSGGTYQLRAYTNWMRNFDDAFFFNKTIEVLDGQTISSNTSKNAGKVDLQFFPEGGDAIANMINLIAFKAVGTDGLGKKIKGQILDSKGQFIANINSIYSGAGSFRLRPQKGESYTAVLSDNSRYPLPPIKSKGYVMRIDNRNSKTVRVKVQASEELKDKTFYIIGHIGGKKYYQTRLRFNEATSIDFEIPKNKLPSGVMTLTLFDQDKKPYAERILFVNNQNELIVRTKLNKKTLKSKDKLVLDINVTDPSGRAVSSAFSLAVTDATTNGKSSNASTILTHLLLQSELKGVLENPGIHFKNQKTSTSSRLDLIMLTHGWRRFNWEQLDEQKNDSIKEFLVDEKHTISGIAKTASGDILKSTSLNIIANTTDKFGFQMYPTRTDSNGRFEVRDLKHANPLKLVFSAYSSKKEPIGVQVTLDTPKNKLLALPKSNFKGVNKIKSKEVIQQETKIYRQAILEQKSEAVNSLTNVDTDEKLDVVNIKGKVDRSTRSPVKSKFGITPDATIYMEDQAVKTSSYLNLLGTVAGVQVQGSGRNISVQIRNLYSPLWILDGVPMISDRSTPFEGGDDGGDSESQAFKSARPVPDFIADLEPSIIERMEVLKGPSTAAYGIRGAGGVILIYTKRGKGNYKEVASSEFDLNTYSEIKEFYLPKYDIEPETRKREDYRTTIYWNPMVKTDINGNATITFFNSDTAKKLQIAIEGISNFGIPGAYLETIGN